MEYNEFEELLKRAELKKAKFAELVSMNPNSVSNWNKSDKVPEWVKSWLELYIKDLKCKQLKAIIKESDLLD